MRLTLLHDQPLVEHYFHPSGRRGLAAEAPAPAEPSGTLSPRARAIVLGAAATVSGLFALDSTVISVALPQIRDDLGGGSATIEWVSSVYLLTFAVTLLPAGRMVDRYGARRMFLSGVAVYVFAAVLGALAQAPWMLILGRGAQGVGAGIVGPAVLVLVTHAFGAERRGWAIGLLGMLLGVFSAAGPLVGGIFTDTVGWQAIFVVHATLAAVAAALVAHTIAPEAAGSPLPLRLASTAALAGVVLGIQVSIIEGPPLRVAGRRRLRRRRRRVRRRPLAARARADGPRPRFHDAANTHGGRVDDRPLGRLLLLLRKHLLPDPLPGGLGGLLRLRDRALGAVPDSQHGRVTSLVSFVSRVASGFGVTFATGVFHLLSGEGVTQALGDRQLPAASRTVGFVRGCLGVGDLQAHLTETQVKQAGFADIQTAAATVDDAFTWIFAGTLFVLAAIVIAGGAAIGLLLLRSRPAPPGS